MLILTRFRIPFAEAEEFRARLEEAHALLSQQSGYRGGSVGRNVDDPELWVLQTHWDGPGAYRRGLGAYEVKVRAWAVLGRAVDEPSAYEVVEPGATLNIACARDGSGQEAP